MNLREELGKQDLELEKEDTTQWLQNVFLEYLKGNKIAKKDEELILDELQRCINQKNYEDSIFKDYLLVCDLRLCRGSCMQSLKVKKIMNELRNIDIFPRSIKLFFEEISNYRMDNKFIESFDKYNKILSENNLSKLDENYNIKDLETSIVNMINQKKVKFMDDNQYIEPFFRSFEFANGIDFTVLFYKKNKNYYLLEKEKEFKIELVFGWEKMLYVRYYLDNSGKSIIYKMMLGKTYTVEKYADMLGIKFSKDFIYDENIDIDKCLGEMEKEQKLLFDISKKKFEKFTNLLTDKLSNIKMEDCKEVQELVDTETKNSSIKVFVISVSPKDIIVIDDCFFAHLCGHLKPENWFYGYFSAEDYFDFWTRTSSETVDLSPLMSVPKTGGDASVVGRTVVGSLLGGTVGGLVGAMSAVEKNNRIEAESRQLAQTNLTRTYTKEEYYLTMEMICEVYSQKIQGSKCYNTLHFHNSEIINDLLATLQVATSDDTLNSTKYIKKYFEENGDVEYNNELINEYINKEVEKERKKTLDNYWKEHPKEKKELEDKLKKLRTEEINLRSEISNIEKKNEKAIEKIKEKYNIKYEEEQKLDMINKKIDDLKEQLSKLGLFAFSKKSEIKNNINSLEDKVNELNKILNSKKSEINKKIEKEIELLNKEKEKKVDILNNNLDKQKEIKFQLNIEG